MKSRKLVVSIALALASLSAAADMMVGGAQMYANKDIVDNAMNSQDHTTLVAAVKAADLVPTLKGNGPFTVFAPTNAAFAELPAGTVDKLLMPANKPMLKQVLTYHVVPGKWDTAALNAEMMAHGGKAWLKTVEGENLCVMSQSGMLVVADAKGHTAHITISDVTQSNGVILVVDKVLMPVSASGPIGANSLNKNPG
jgi:uncharacterized surface protein with fasciclin (FAS1) repeats